MMTGEVGFGGLHGLMIGVMKCSRMTQYIAFKFSFALASFVALFKPSEDSERGPVRLLIEAGVQGWMEPAPGLLEIEQSAREYLGTGAVFRLEVSGGSRSYIRDLYRRVSEVRPTHYFYDTRTGSQNPLWGLLQAILISAILACFRCTPLTILTNFPARRWRRQVSAVTARAGLILVLIRAEEAKVWLPHERIVGPIFMPFSAQKLRSIRSNFPRSLGRSVSPNVTFIGTIYEPRKTELDRIEGRLAEMGIDLVRHERFPESEKIDQEQYWRVLRSSPVLVTTAEHIRKRGADAGFPPHMVYRYTEAMVAETCLVAPDLGGPLEPWVHFVPLGNPEDLDETFSRVFNTKNLVEEVSRNASEFISRRIEDQSWWREIDDALFLFQQQPLKTHTAEQ